jgi:Tat protein secretion system quality control protein TatD with DNase activity
LRPESSDLIKSLPSGKIFLETDGADVDIRDIYKKVAKDLNLSVDELKSIIITNFKEFFR